MTSAPANRRFKAQAALLSSRLPLLTIRLGRDGSRSAGSGLSLWEERPALGVGVGGRAGGGKCDEQRRCHPAILVAYSPRASAHYPIFPGHHAPYYHGHSLTARSLLPTPSESDQPGEKTDAVAQVKQGEGEGQSEHVL